MTPAEILSAGRLIAKKKVPYFRTILLSFEARQAPGLGTIGCTARGILLWDPAFVAKLTPEEMAGGWVHECMHRLNKHAERIGVREPKPWNIAGDLAINPSVEEMGLTLPGGAFKGCYPADFGFEKGLTADEYYELLRTLAQKQQAQQGGGSTAGAGGEPGESGGEGGESDSEAQGGGKDSPKMGGGFCGSCAGRPVPGEPPSGEGRSDGELARINRATAEAIRDHASNHRGTIPAGLLRWADEFLTPPRLPWWQKLERVLRQAVAWRAGAVQHRWDGPGRRQAGLGYGPGKPVMPRLRQPVPRVACAIDTSGSMGHHELAQALRQVNGVLKASGAEVDFLSCDAEVHGLGKIRRIEDAIPLCKGGGGTDFRPVFETFQKRRPRPEVVIFATDGCGPAPETCPNGMTVVWLLIGPYRQAPATWGTVVEVDELRPEELRRAV